MVQRSEAVILVMGLLLTALGVLVFTLGHGRQPPELRPPGIAGDRYVSLWDRPRSSVVALDLQGEGTLPEVTRRRVAAYAAGESGFPLNGRGEDQVLAADGVAPYDILRWLDILTPDRGFLGPRAGAGTCGLVFFGDAGGEAGAWMWANHESLATTHGHELPSLTEKPVGEPYTLALWLRTKGVLRSDILLDRWIEKDLETFVQWQRRQTGGSWFRVERGPETGRWECAKHESARRYDADDTAGGRGASKTPWGTVLVAEGGRTALPTDVDGVGSLVEVDPRQGGARALTSFGRARWQDVRVARAEDGHPLVLYAVSARPGGRLLRWTSADPYRSAMAKAEARNLLEKGTLRVAHPEGRWVAPAANVPAWNGIRGLAHDPGHGRLLLALDGDVIEAVAGDDDTFRRTVVWRGWALDRIDPGKATFDAAADPRVVADPRFAVTDAAALAVDALGGVWFGTDGSFARTDGRRPDGIYYLDLEAGSPTEGLAFRIAVAPSDAAALGPSFDSSERTLFFSAQHPGKNLEADVISTWPPRRDSERIIR